MGKRPAVDRGRNIPDPDRMPHLKKDKEAAEEYSKKSSKWVMEGMHSDKKK